MSCICCAGIVPLQLGIVLVYITFTKNLHIFSHSISSASGAAYWQAADTSDCNIQNVITQPPATVSTTQSPRDKLKEIERTDITPGMSLDQHNMMIDVGNILQY